MVNAGDDILIAYPALDAARTALVGPRHPLACTIAVDLEGAHVGLQTVTVFPDARPTARRITQRVSRRRGRGRAR